MAFTRLNTTYAGGPNVHVVNFPLGYLSQDDVTARVNNEVDGLGDPVYRPLTWLTEGTVAIGGTALVNGDEIELERTVDKDTLEHDYADGEIINEPNLDASFKQAIMLVHEVLDGRFGVLTTDLDAGGNKITNVADGVDDGDAVNYAQLVDMTGNAPVYAAEAAASAADALVSENNAAAALAACLTIYDNFDDRYLGQKSSAPTLDNDGNALIDGALYYNTVDNKMYVYDLGTTTWLAIEQNLADGSVTNAKLATMAAATIKGRALGAGTGVPVDLTASQVRAAADAEQTISGRALTSVTVALDDKVVIQDTSDSNNVKTVTTRAVSNLSYVEGTVVATTSGTSHDVTGFASGTKKITIPVSGISTNGTSNLLLQLIDAGGVENTGYLSAANTNTDSGSTVERSTAGFLLTGAWGTSSDLHGEITLTRLNASTNKWVCSFSTGVSSADQSHAGGGSKSLSAELTGFRLTTVNGTDVFDAGEFNSIGEGA